MITISTNTENLLSAVLLKASFAFVCCFFFHNYYCSQERAPLQVLKYQCYVTFINTSISYIPDSSCLHNVPNHKLLNSFVLGYTSCTVCTTYKLDMSTAMLATPTVTPLLCLHVKHEN